MLLRRRFAAAIGRGSLSGVTTTLSSGPPPHAGAARRSSGVAGCSAPRLRRLAPLVVALAALCTGSSALAGTSDSDPAAGQVLRVGTKTAPDSLNPFVSGNRTARAISSLIYDRLVLADANLRAVPGLARSWKRDENGKRWVFRLRGGMRWSDGRQVTARDVAFTLSAAMSAPRSPYARTLANVSSVDRSGSARLIVTLTHPSQHPPVLDVPILPRHVWGSVTTVELRTFENEPPVGSGRYRLVPGVDDGVIRLEANPDHWSDPSPVGVIEIRFYPDEEAIADALQSGEIDVADDLSPSAFEGLGTAGDIVQRAAATATFISLGMNTGAPRGNGRVALRDSRVRRAIAFALDRDLLRREVLGEQGITGTTIVPPVSPFHAELSADELIGFDPDRAASLLDRAGLRDRDEDGQRELRRGQPLELRLYTRAALPETERLGELIASSLEAVGITVKPEVLTDSELARRIARGRYDLFIWGWTADPDPEFILSVLTCDEMRRGGLSDTYFCDPTYEQLYEKQRGTTARRQRREIIRHLQLRAYRESPYVVLYYRPNLQAYRGDRFQVAPKGLETVLVMTGDPGLPLGLEPIAGPVRPSGDVEPPQEAGAAEAVSDTSDTVVSRRLALVVAVAVAVLAFCLLALLLVLRRRSRKQSAGDAEEDDGPELEVEPNASEDPDP